MFSFQKVLEAMKKLILLVSLTIVAFLVVSTSKADKKEINTMELPPTFMNDVLNHIQATYPSQWLDDLVVNNDNIAVEIKHPNNTETYLSVDIFPEQVLVAVLEEANREIPFDLGGFHFDFSPDQMSEIQTFFNSHHQTGVSE